MGTRIFGGLIAIVLLASPAAYWTLSEEPLEVTVTTLKRDRVEQTVTGISSGTVMARQDSMVAARLIGTVVKLPVKQGDRVQEGQLLLEIDHDQLDAQVALSEANLKAGYSLLEQAKLSAQISREISATRISQAKAQQKVAEQDFNRAEKLLEDKVGTQTNFDQARLALDLSRENLAAAKASDRESLIRQEEIKTAQSNIDQLKAALDVAKSIRETAFIRAPFSGIIGAAFAELGEAVAPGMPLVQLIMTTDLYIRSPFDESHAATIQVGQLARIEIDSHRKKEFKGTVIRKSPIITVLPDFSRSLNIDVRIDEDQHEFLVGMSASVTILVDEKENVLSAPSEALIREQYAYVVDDGVAVRRKVTVGIGNWSSMEIIEGLEEGETLITSVSLRDLKDGVPIKIVDELE